MRRDDVIDELPQTGPPNDADRDLGLRGAFFPEIADPKIEPSSLRLMFIN
jgi:hypothetical protein